MHKQIKGRCQRSRATSQVPVPSPPMHQTRHLTVTGERGPKASRPVHPGGCGRPSDFFLFCAILILLLKRRNLDLLRHPVQSRPKLQEHAHQARFSTSWEEKPRLKLRVAPLAGGSPLTLTSCCGKGPREFSGTLMGGMTQSRFCRLSPLELWCCGHGSSVSFGGWTGSRAAFFFPFCRKGEKRQRSLVRFCRGKGII